MNYGILSRRVYTALYLMTFYAVCMFGQEAGCHMMVMKRIIDNSRVGSVFTAREGRHQR